MLALAASLSLASCSLAAGSPPDVSTSKGVRLELGPVLVSGLMVLSTAEDAPGTVLGAIQNDGRRTVVLYIGLTARSHTAIGLYPGETVLLGPHDQPVLLDSVPAPPGGPVELTLSTAQGDWATQEVPVLDATFQRYDGLAPQLDG